MDNVNELLTAAEVSRVLGVSEFTVRSLVRQNKIPHRLLSRGGNTNRKLRFNIAEINSWLRNNARPEPEEKNSRLDNLRSMFFELYSGSLNYLQTLDASRSRRPRRGFSLVKVPNKKHGFLFYVRYSENGKPITSRWNTHTNNREEAELFAQTNRQSLIEAYTSRHKFSPLYSLLESYYEKESPYLSIDKSRNRTLNDKTRSVYFNFMKKVFIPYLKTRKVHSFPDITPPVIADLQNILLQKGKKPQTINRYLGGVNIMFSHFLMTGRIRENVFDKVKSLRSRGRDARVRGCHDVDSLGGVFSSPWEDTLSYLLCLVIYSTGLRNSEIERLRAGDITRIGKHRFLNIRESKTDNGIRIVPLHPVVYGELARYIEETGKTPGEYLFTPGGGHNQSTLYRKANAGMGARLGLSPEELDSRGISFYSGRHFWKTLMNSGGLGEDIEEYFMGHKTSGDVSRRYNHKDKQGLANLEKKAGLVFAILDKKLFKGRPR
jgi:integrase